MCILHACALDRFRRREGARAAAKEAAAKAARELASSKSAERVARDEAAARGVELIRVEQRDLFAKYDHPAEPEIVAALEKYKKYKAGQAIKNLKKSATL